MAESVRRPRRLGDILVESGLITREQLALALHDQENFGGRLGTVLFDQGLITEAEYLRAVGEQLGIRSTDFEGVTIPEKVMKLLSRERAWEWMVVPMSVKAIEGARTLLLAMADPTDEEVLAAVAERTGCRVRPVLAFDNSIRQVLMEYYQDRFGTGDYIRTASDPPRGVSSRRESLPAQPDAALSPRAGDDGHCQPAHDRFSLEIRAFLRVLIEKKILHAEDYARALKELQALKPGPDSDIPL